jgi:hypothetical protein
MVLLYNRYWSQRRLVVAKLILKVLFPLMLWYGTLLDQVPPDAPQAQQSMIGLANWQVLYLLGDILLSLDEWWPDLLAGGIGAFGAGHLCLYLSFLERGRLEEAQGEESLGIVFHAALAIVYWLGALCGCVAILFQVDRSILFSSSTIITSSSNNTTTSTSSNNTTNSDNDVIQRRLLLLLLLVYYWILCFVWWAMPLGAGFALLIVSDALIGLTLFSESSSPTIHVLGVRVTLQMDTLIIAFYWLFLICATTAA